MGKAGQDQASRYLNSSADAPVILLSDKDNQEQSPLHPVTHLKMPFRPSQLMAMARQAIANVA